MTLKTLLAATVISLGTAAAAQAATITVDFPSGTSDRTTSNNSPFFFTTGDSYEETFTDTGVADLVTIDLAINLTDNFLTDAAFVNFDVLVNSSVVGGFTISEGDGLGQFDFSFGVVDADAVEDDYTIRFELTNTVPSGDGSVAFDLSNSTATLAAVPLPASAALLLAGLGGLGFAGRRKNAA